MHSSTPGGKNTGCAIEEKPLRFVAVLRLSLN